jgi:NAD(P) transhydrogenase subunit alpha
MIVGIPRETYPDERRVALVPGLLPHLAEMGLEVTLESGAGRPAGFPDSEYQENGGRVAFQRVEVFASADILLQVRGLGSNPDLGRADLGLLRPGQVLLGFLNPLGAPEAMLELAQRGVTALALELLPRISRAQPMDALTSMAMVAGYKAVLLAAATLPRLFPMMVTAAGTITPAHVFVVGAGVAGLQAIATARRLGAVVEAYDVRPAAKQEVESLGARFVELALEAADSGGAGEYAQAMNEDFYRRQREMMDRVVAGSDVVITTAAVPGKKAPLLITGEMVKKMRPGSVIVDLAAESEGNCELTRPGETVNAGGVTILGPVNLASTVPFHASQMYARNLVALLRVLVKDGRLDIDVADPIIRDTLVTHQGKVSSQRVREILDPQGSGPAGNPPQASTVVDHP